MVVQTTGYFNLSILFYWGLVFLFKIFFGGGNFFFFNFLVFHYQVLGLHCRLGKSVNSSNGMMMRYVNMIRYLSQSKGNRLSH